MNIENLVFEVVMGVGMACIFFYIGRHRKVEGSHGCRCTYSRITFQPDQTQPTSYFGEEPFDLSGSSFSGSFSDSFSSSSTFIFDYGIEAGSSFNPSTGLPMMGV